ncbi:MAG: hypothetical protein AAB737_03475, partial [Patescibacteria group bacterium]
VVKWAGLVLGFLLVGGEVLMAAFLALLLSLLPPRAAAVTIDFEGLTDLDAVTDQFAAQGVLFESTAVLTAGISLNEFKFPPAASSPVMFKLSPCLTEPSSGNGF